MSKGGRHYRAGGRSTGNRSWGVTPATPATLQQTVMPSALAGTTQRIAVDLGPLPQQPAVFSTPTAAQIRNAQRQQGQLFTGYPPPGTPIPPMLRYGTKPLWYNFMIGQNAYTAVPRGMESVSFYTMGLIIEGWSLPKRAIWTVVDFVSALDYKCTTIKGVKNDNGAYDEDIAACERLLANLHASAGIDYTEMTRQLAFLIWAYDAPVLFIDRDRAGRAGAPWVIDGRTISPLIDELGRTPAGDCPAYAQIYNGTPLKHFFADDMIYMPWRRHPGSLYGDPPIQSLLVEAANVIAMQQFLTKMMAKGFRPGALLEAPPPGAGKTDEENATTLLTYEEDFNLSWEATGNAFGWVPNGTSVHTVPPLSFPDQTYRDMNDYCFAHMGVQPIMAGNTDNSNRSTSEVALRVQIDQSAKPLAKALSRIYTAYFAAAGYPAVTMEYLGLEAEEDALKLAQRDETLAQAGIKSPRLSAKERGIVVSPDNPVPWIVVPKGSVAFFDRNDLAGLDLVALGSDNHGAYKADEGVLTAVAERAAEGDGGLQQAAGREVAAAAAPFRGGEPAERRHPAFGAAHP